MLVFIFAGTIKGVVGLGLPPVVLGILTALTGIHSAMAMVALPALITNFYQAVSGSHGKLLWQDHWHFFLAATMSIALGCWLALQVNPANMSLVLGLLLFSYAVLGLTKITLSIDKRWEPTAGFTLGIANGVFTGLTGSSAVPGVFYLQSVGLPKDKLIQAMGILFTCSSLGLSIGLFWMNILTISTGVISLIALIPAIIGMIIGGKIRSLISVQLFQRIFFFSLLLLGGYIVATHL